jgi:N utilization substance protein B
LRPRSAGRRLALQYLFMADMNGFAGHEPPESFFLSQRLAARDEAAVPDDGEEGGEEDGGGDDRRRADSEAFALALIREVEGNLEAIDAAIGAVADNWAVSRIGRIERNVIRIAAAELRLGATPRRVILDEAVELAKRFGDKDSGGFVNGVADRLTGGA